MILFKTLITNGKERIRMGAVAEPGLGFTSTGAILVLFILLVIITGAGWL